MREQSGHFHLRKLLAAALLCGGWTRSTDAQSEPSFSLYQIQTNQEMRLKVDGPKGLNYRLDATADLRVWTPLIALTNTTGSVEHTDTAAPFENARFYRAAQLAGTNVLTGDYLATTNGDAVIHPVFHATFVMTWAGIALCVDPADGLISQLKGLPLADIVLVTHEHTDHYSVATINAIKKTNATLVVSKSVFSALPATLKTNALLMTNGATTELLGMTIKAIPAYNANHPKGNGNGYILGLGGKTLYISGDTGDTPEMRALTGIDVAFVCMDGVYNMSMPVAASAVREFRPKVVFPYHYNTLNPATFKQLVGTDLGIEVRLRKWQ